MNKNLTLLLLACSILLTIYLTKKNSEKGLKPVKIEIPKKQMEKEEKPANFEQKEETPQQLKLSFSERKTIQEIDEYADSVAFKLVPAFDLKASPGFHDNLGNYFSGEFYSDSKGLPLRVIRKIILKKDSSQIQTIYTLKNGKIVKREILETPKGKGFNINKTFDYFAQKDTIDPDSGRKEFYNIGTKLMNISFGNGSPTIDTTIQYLKMTGDSPVIYPEEDLNDVLNAAHTRGDFALKIDTLLAGNPPFLRLRTFDDYYSADFQINEKDATFQKIESDIDQYQGKIITIDLGLGLNGTSGKRSNFYNGGQIFE